MTLFAFGRTIHCTCGRRVAAATRVRETGEPDDPRFIADAMLGRLSRWLRILGFDTAWEEHIDDEALVRRAVEERRVILTRDRALPREWRVAGIEVIAAEEPLAQLREIAERFGLARRARLFSRCSRCNSPLLAATRDEVGDRVPARVVRERTRFRSCPGCGRVYWEGSHTDRMREALARAVGPLAG